MSGTGSFYYELTDEIDFIDAKFDKHFYGVKIKE